MTGDTERSNQTLWHNPGFVRLWLSRVVSGLGSRITSAALPLTAAIVLEASPSEMALLVIAGQLPDVLFGLLIGSWIDRGRHRQFLRVAEIGRAVLLTTVPLTALAGMLTIPVLLAVTFGCALLSLIFSVASVAVLPAVVGRARLVEANARFTMSDSVIALIGPSLAGPLIQLAGAPKAILADAASFLVSARILGRVRLDEPGRRSASVRPSIRRDVIDGVRELVATPLLRALTISSAVFAIGLAMQATVFMLFLTGALDLRPATIGFVLASGGVGSIAGAWLAERSARWMGQGRSILLGTLVEALAAFVVPLALFAPAPLAFIVAGQVLNGAGYAVYSVNHVSLRQSIVRPDMLGRITAGRRFVTFCIAPVGAALGGLLGETAGLPATLAIAGCLLLAGTVVMWASPVRTVTSPNGFV